MRVGLPWLRVQTHGHADWSGLGLGTHRHTSVPALVLAGDACKEIFLDERAHSRDCMPD